MSFEKQDLLLAMEEAYREVNRSKRLEGFVYGLNDCFCLFIHYDRLLFGGDNFDWLLGSYTSRRSFVRQLRARGMSRFEDLTIPGYYKEGGENPVPGDIGAMKDTDGFPTTVLFHGDFWYNSSPDKKFDKLPRRLVEPNLLFLRTPVRN